MTTTKMSRRMGKQGGKAGRRRRRGRQWTPVGFRELTGRVDPRRKFDARHPRSPRALHSRRSLISIPRGPVERSNSKKRDGWRHYERLRAREACSIPEVHSHARQDFVGLVVVCQLVTLVRLSDFLRRRMTRSASPSPLETMPAKASSHLLRPDHSEQRALSLDGLVS